MAEERGGCAGLGRVTTPPYPSGRRHGWYLALGEAAGEAVGEAAFRSGDGRRNASRCHGLAGNGELFLDLYLAARRARLRFPHRDA